MQWTEGACACRQAGMRRTQERTQTSGGVKPPRCSGGSSGRRNVVVCSRVERAEVWWCVCVVNLCSSGGRIGGIGGRKNTMPGNQDR